MASHDVIGSSLLYTKWERETCIFVIHKYKFTIVTRDACEVQEPTPKMVDSVSHSHCLIWVDQIQGLKSPKLSPWVYGAAAQAMSDGGERI